MTIEEEDPGRTTPLYRRLAEEARDNMAIYRTLEEMKANYRDSGAPMWAWLTGRKP